MEDTKFYMDKLENEVCNFEAAKKIFEIGIHRDTQWYWVGNVPIKYLVSPYFDDDFEDISRFTLYPAYSFSELVGLIHPDYRKQILGEFVHYGELNSVVVHEFADLLFKIISNDDMCINKISIHDKEISVLSLKRARHNWI